MKDTKIQKLYVDYGFGFPVKILNAPMRKIRGSWALDLNFEKYEKAALAALAVKPVRLSGNEVKFIRHHFEMTQKRFGNRFGDVAHSAVIKWERAGDKATKMGWAIEKDIRLFIVRETMPKYLGKVYTDLEESKPERDQNIKIDTEEVKVA